MPPKVKFTREEIIRSALDIVRETGPEGLTARSLAARLGCSVKPIFGLFRSMEEVQQEVLSAGYRLYGQTIAQAMEAGKYPPYKASGMAYISFARTRPQLFKELFMRDRTGESPAGDDPLTRSIVALIVKNTGLSEQAARQLHIELWIFIHGIAAMLVTGYLDLEEPVISSMLTDVYLGLLNRSKENTP